MQFDDNDDEGIHNYFFMQQSWANNNAIERQRKGSERKNYFSDNVTIIVTFVV